VEWVLNGRLWVRSNRRRAKASYHIGDQAEEVFRLLCHTDAGRSGSAAVKWLAPSVMDLLIRRRLNGVGGAQGRSEARRRCHSSCSLPSCHSSRSPSAAPADSNQLSKSPPVPRFA
jgi:hypothetical protein